MSNWLQKISQYKPYKPGDALAMAKYLSNREFDSQEEARAFVIRTIELNNNSASGAVFGKNDPADVVTHFIFPEIDGKFKVHPVGGMPPPPEPPPLEYLTNNGLRADQINVYQSFYGPEFGSIMSPILYINIDDIYPTESVHQEKVESLMEFIREGGELRPILMDDGYGMLDGHHRYYAAKALGIKKIPVVFKYNPDEFTPEGVFDWADEEPQ